MSQEKGNRLRGRVFWLQRNQTQVAFGVGRQQLGLHWAPLHRGSSARSCARRLPRESATEKRAAENDLVVVVAAAENMRSELRRVCKPQINKDNVKCKRAIVSLKNQSANSQDKTKASGACISRSFTFSPVALRRRDSRCSPNCLAAIRKRRRKKG